MSYKSKFIYFKLKFNSIHNVHHNLYDSNLIVYTHMLDTLTLIGNAFYFSYIFFLIFKNIISYFLIILIF